MPKIDSNKKAAHKRAVFFDKLAKWIINTGGFAVIIAVVGILVFIVLEGLPLLYNADSNKVAEIKNTKANVLFTGIEEYQRYAYVFTDSFKVDVIELSKKKQTDQIYFDELSGRKVFSFSDDLNNNNFIYGLDSGYVAWVEFKFKSFFDKNDNRVITPNKEFKELIKIDDSNNNVVNTEISIDEDGNPAIVAYNNKDLIYYSTEAGLGLLDDEEKTVYKNNLTSFIDGKVVNFALSNDGKELVVVNDKNEIFYLSLSDKEEPQFVQKLNNPHPGTNITASKYILGNQSIVFGDDKGNVYSLMKSLDDKSEAGFKLQLSHNFEKMTSAVTYINASSRDKNFIVADKNGDVNLYFLTSERLLINDRGNKIAVREANLAPKANGFITRYADGTIVSTHVDNPHPEVSYKTLFAKVLYEGYKEPAYVWQSTGGSDSFESKFSMIPLIIGTMKGTIYAMLFAIPLALLGALYTSTFSHPKLRNKIKPVVEILAALPSVVIGFLAGLWLAPLLEKIFPGAVLMFIIEPLILIVSVLLWRKFSSIRKIAPLGYEIFLIIPLLILGAWLSIQLGPLFEKFVFSGDYRHWLNDYFNANYDQRNSIIVGFAMGFAVIPIIFTIAEDSLSSVPQHLMSASLALGATKWQTAIRVVLPTASPGIFSAVMIGFGRAIGETMIVLMATGNTPILSFSPFNGMRTLSANIAVEIPEAPYLGTLYRVLFISAALLFVFTFIVNTAAEIIRQRLRKKYMHI